MSDFDPDELDADLDEMLDGIPQTADVFSADGTQVARAIRIVLGDVRAEGSANRAAWREETSSSVVLKAADVPFPLRAGVTLRLPDGLRLRVTDATATPGDVAVTLTVENRGKA